MLANSIEQVYELINRKESYITIPVEINPLNKIRLYLTGKADVGVEIFGIGGLEARNLFLVEYMTTINKAISKGYHVYAFRDGEYFSKGKWYLEFDREQSE
jgi:hypothetical protein